MQVQRDIPTGQYELYAEFGIAAEKAQVLEIDAGNIALLYAALFLDRTKLTDDERKMLRTVLDDCDRSTLGKVLKRVKSIGDFDDSMLSVVDEALERRNYLMHRFYLAHNFAIGSEAGRKEMVTELKDIQAKLDRAHFMLLGVYGCLEKMAGLHQVPDHIKNEAARVQREAIKVKL